MPTAHSVAAPGNVAAASVTPKVAPPVSSVHAVPFQRRITARNGPPLTPGSCPTAYTSVAERAATPVRAGSVTGVGLGTMLHDVPFQFSISVLPLSSPTAQASAGDMAVTAPSSRDEPNGPAGGWAIGTTVQAVPLKWSASAWPALVPTSQMSLT